MRTFLFSTWLAVLVFGIAGINIYHHAELPTINKYRITKEHSLNFKSFNIVRTHYNVRLESEIRENELYVDIITMLQEAKKGDTVTFHLYGYGGDVSSMELLINNIKASKAYVIMSVEAPVYSAHAYLATQGNALRMSPYTFLMFHCSSLKNADCSKQSGSDRGVSNVEHCLALKAAHSILENKLLNSVTLLTSNERAKISQGYDVYLSEEEVKNRQTMTRNGTTVDQQVRLQGTIKFIPYVK